ncbi:MAG: hypothetical protein MI975_06990 [Cytophagales bacterium]|nr:hypothetical protein [Cytophagales bacterium]
MKKAIVLLFILALITTGAFYYFGNFHQKKIDSWILVPSSAIVAFENKSFVENWNRIIEKPVWKTFRKVPYFKNWEESLINVDSISGKNGSVDLLFKDKALIISIHITSSNEFDFLFNLNLGDREGETVFNNIVGNILKHRSVVRKTRTYQGLELYELSDRKSKSTFTYFIHKHVVVGSFTPFLVEDVVRNVTDGFNDTFKSQVGGLNNISKLENDEGDVYIDFAKLPDLIASFLIEGKSSEMKSLAEFSGDTYLDIKVTDDELLLNGLSTIDLTNNKSFIGTFRNQNPGKLKVTDLVPNSTAILYHVSFTDFEEWQNQLSKYWSQSDPNQFQKALDFEEKYDLNLNWIHAEAANAILETPNREKPDQLIFIGINDKDLVFNELNKLAETIGNEQGDSIYLEIYNELPIVQIPLEEFPAMIMGKYFSGFENSFVTTYKDYLVLGNSMKAVKDFINAIEDENNWGKSVRQNLFLENTLSESSFSLIINTPFCWHMIMRSLNKRWADLFRKHENPIKSFDRIALQISNLDQKFYTSLAIGHEEKTVSKTKLGRLKKTQSAYTISPIISKPFIVKNHNNNKFEVLVQDSLNILYQISNEGVILWGDSIIDPLVSDIHQIDYYKNSKLQYLFATKNKIHLLDRNGDYVENFPVQLEEAIDLQHLSVIDYDNSKRYRFMAVDKEGAVYLYDKEGKNLEGWTPRTLAGPLSVPGFHIRVKGGDCMVALQENGVLNVMNRRSKMYPGFPIDLKITRAAGMFVDIGNDFNSTKLITVSEEGEIIEVNLKGKIMRREQLYKPSRESKFWIVNDALEKTYVIVRREYDKVSIIDRDGEIIFENNISASGDMVVQYYHFSSDNQVFVIIDVEQEFTYVFNKEGKSVSFEPLESGKPIGLLYSNKSKEFQIYKCFKNNFSIETFN